MPKPPTGKTYEKQYTEQDLTAAVAAIKDGMPKREAARKFNIPRATLQFRISSNPIKTRPGPSTVLTETEEKKLADWIITSSKKGFPRRKEDILHSVEQFMRKTPRPNKFKENKPGEGWYKLFLKRHPYIVQRTAEAVTSASANVSETNIRNWFKQIENTLTVEELKILDDPNRIFNGDETGFQFCPKQGKVLAEKGSRDVYEIDMAAAKSSITVMFTFSASGSVTPPLVIYPLKRMRADIRESVPSHWGISLSDNGWMTKEIFFQYVTNILYPHLVSKNIQFPIILFVDGHKSHINYELSQKCKELGIVLVALYPNATRILQPADVSAFKPIKNEWRKALLEWRRQNVSKQLTKVDFGRVLTSVVEKHIKKEGIINGFRVCGLYPWNPNSINYAKCLGLQKQAEPVPMPEKILTLSNFKNLVGPNYLNMLQNKVSIDNNFYKALEKIYKFLNDTKISDDNSNDQRYIHIGDEWLPIDDVPIVILPNASDKVEEFVTMASKVNTERLANQDISIEVTAIDQGETFKEKIKTDENKNYIGKKSIEMIELENIKVGKGQIESEILNLNLLHIKGTKKVIDIKQGNPENSGINILGIEMIKEDNKEHTEPRKINSVLQEVNEYRKTERINNMEKENMILENEKNIETDNKINIQSESTVQNEIYDKVEEINMEKLNADDLDNICIETIEIENAEEIQKNVKKFVNIFEELDNIDSLNEMTTPKKIEDFLYKAPTPKRKGKILSKNTGIYVLTSEKWLESAKEKQNEKEKVLAEKEHRKKTRELAKQAKVVKKEENKKINKRKCTNEMEIQADKCKKRKTGFKQTKEKENVTNENDKPSSTKEATITKSKEMNVNKNKVLFDIQKHNDIQSQHKKSKINIISNIPISAEHNVKKIILEKCISVKPDLILNRPKIPNRRTTFRNEKELEEYLNTCNDGNDSP